jgi:hypothetical protein
VAGGSRRKRFGFEKMGAGESLGFIDARHEIPNPIDRVKERQNHLADQIRHYPRSS